MMVKYRKYNSHEDIISITAIKYDINFKPIADIADEIEDYLSDITTENIHNVPVEIYQNFIIVGLLGQYIIFGEEI